MPSPSDIEKALQQIRSHQSVLGSELTTTLNAALNHYRDTLLSTAPLQAHQKQVTVLFADVSGFHTMANASDAEHIINLMNQFWLKLDAAVSHHDGYFTKHLSSGCTALWGVGQAREDDAERAVRSALEMKDAQRRFENEHPDALLKLRIGIHSGPVILGHVGATAGYTAIGEAMDTATRLGSEAPADSVLISHDTYQRVRDRFVCEERKRIWVKERTHQLRTYTVSHMVDSSHSFSAPAIEGINTRTIGRTTVLTQALAACYQAINHQSPRLITLSGEAGMGKSRLIGEIAQWLERQAQAISSFSARAVQEMQYRPYVLLRDSLMAHWKISPHALSLEDIQRQITEKLMASDAGLTTEQMFRLFQLLGLMPSTTKDKRAGQVEAEAALIQYIQKISESTAIFWVLEDIQWADSSSLELMAAIYQRMEGHPFLLVASARTEFMQQEFMQPSQQQWGRWAAEHTHVTLNALSQEHAHELAQEILQMVGEIPESLETLLVQHANGNPLYMEELVMMLIADGIIITHSSEWIVNTNKLSKVRLPPTLTGILQARLESLPSPERELLCQSAVVGQTFWPEVVEYLQQQTLATQKDVERLWSELVRKEFIRPEEESVLKIKAYTFNNPIFRQVARESVLISARRSYHAHIAQWLIDHYGKEETLFSLIAEHLELAQDNSQAVVYLRHAGEQAQQHYGFHESIHFFKRALGLLVQSNNSAERIQLTREIGRAMVSFGQLDLAKSWLQESLSMARQSKAPQQIMANLKDLTDLAKLRGDLREAKGLIDEGLVMIKKHGDQLESSAYFQKTKETFSGLLSSTTEKANDLLSSEHAEQAKKRLGKALTGLLSGRKKGDSEG